MVKKVLVNNLSTYNLSILQLLMEIGAINYLEKNEALNNKICKCVKDEVLEKLQFCNISTIPLECKQKKG